MLRRLIIMALVAFLAVPLAGCGKKSAPARPEGSDHPRQYPTR